MPDQPISVPRRPLDIDDYVEIVKRHRSWLLGPAFFGLVAGVVVAYLWPDSYRAVGQIRVVPPQVPTRLVQTNISEEMSARVAAIYQNITSRQNLLSLIQTYNLYPKERKRLPTEDVIEQMRQDIRMGSLGQLQSGAPSGGGRRGTVTAFEVGYSYSDRRLAQRVCQDVISRFTDESIKARATMSVMTTEFFKDQYESAKRELDAIDGKIAAFRSKNLGELPEQQQMLFGRMSAMETSVQAISGQISRAQQDKLQLESQLRDLRDQAQAGSQPAAPEAQAAEVARDPRVAELDKEIERLEQYVASLRQSYKESHPDVQRATGYLRAKQKQREQLVREVEAGARESAGAARPRPAAGPNAAAQSRLREIQSMVAKVQAALQAKDMEIGDLDRQLNETRARLKQLSARIEGSPGASQEYLQLVRERDVADRHYQELGRKMQDSSLATDLENRKQGEMLEVLESPTLPEEPYAPKRGVIIVAGLVLGLGLGVSLAGGRELKDTSLKNLKDVRAYTKLAILGSVPLLENDFVLRRRRRLGMLVWVAATLLGLLLMAGAVIYYYYTTRT
jgi:polysaccharide chain length determinant protein (PEP-CTERM system associated)